MAFSNVLAPELNQHEGKRDLPNKLTFGYRPCCLLRVPTKKFQAKYQWCSEVAPLIFVWNLAHCNFLVCLSFYLPPNALLLSTLVCVVVFWTLPSGLIVFSSYSSTSAWVRVFELSSSCKIIFSWFHHRVQLFEAQDFSFNQDLIYIRETGQFLFPLPKYQYALWRGPFVWKFTSFNGR